MRQDNLLVQGAAIFIYSCTLHHKIQSENQHLTTKRKAQVQTLFCSSYYFHTLLIFPSYRKTKNLLFFSFFSQNYYICTSSKSRAKQCSETRTATKSLPVTELPTLYVLSIKLLKEIYRFFIKKPSPEPISPPPKDINYKRNKYIFSHYSFVHPIKPFVHPCLRHKFYFCHAIGTQLSEETPAFKI